MYFIEIYLIVLMQVLKYRLNSGTVLRVHETDASQYIDELNPLNCIHTLIEQDHHF